MKKVLLLATLTLSTFSASAQVLDRIIAVVGEEPVLQSDLTRLRDDLKKSPALANIYKLDPKQITEQSLLDLLIDERVIRNTLKELDMTVSDSDVETQIDGIAKQNKISRKQLEDSLSNEGVPIAVYRANIRAQLERRNIFDRELRRSGGVSEADIRSVYAQRAQKELRLFIIAGAKAQLEALSKKKLSVSEVSDLSGKLNSTDLGWVGSSAMNEAVAVHAAKATVGDFIGPVKVGGKLQLFFVADERRGSDEEFERVKGQLTAVAQSEDFDKRFHFWLERKKKDMNIVLNK